MRPISPAWRLHHRIAGLLLLCLGASACAGLNNYLPDRSEPEFYQPPVAAAPSPIVLPTHTWVATAIPTPIPSPTPSCTNNLTYKEDLTIPDGTAVQPGEVLDKRWQVENSGTCNWGDRYRLKLIAGPDLGASSEQALYPARSSTLATIRLAFTAPDEPETYRSAWQAYSPEGDPFGDPIFIEIMVVPPSVSP